MKKLLMIVNEDRFFLSHRKGIALAAQDAGWDVTIVCKDTGRYPQTLYPGSNDGPLLSKYKGKGLIGKIAAWEHRIYESAAINPPDLTVKLVVPTEVAIERKPEMTAEEIETKKSIVMGLKLSENTLVVDTSRPFESTRAEIMDAIWKIL